MPFDPGEMCEDLDSYFARCEAEFDDITPGAEKRVIWHDAPGVKTDWVVLYVHGFSATSEEIRPVPDNVANSIGANLVYTRLHGHGRTDPDALATGSINACMTDLAEALAVARQISDRVIVIATSNGATLTAAALHMPNMMDDVAGVVLVSPNFRLKTGADPLLTLPTARYWLPLIAGRRLTFEPRSPAQTQYWTLDYPSVALFPVSALAKAVRRMDFSTVSTPAPCPI